MSKAEAMTTVDTMAKKYLDADAYNGAKNEGTAKALGFVAMLTSALQAEYETVEKMVKKDRDQSEADRAGEHNAADARFTGEKKRVDDLVAASLAVMQAAKKVMDAEMKEADRLIALEETAQGNYDAALTKQSNDGKAGRDLRDREVQDAKDKAGSCKTLVDKVSGDDIDYLEDERAAIKELKEILAGMDLGVKHKKTKTYSKAASKFVKWAKCAQKRQACSSGSANTAQSYGECKEQAFAACSADDSCVATTVKKRGGNYFLTYSDGACVADKAYGDVHWDLYTAK